MDKKKQYLQNLDKDNNNAENSALWLVLDWSTGTKYTDDELINLADSLYRYSQIERPYSTSYFAYVSMLINAYLGRKDQTLKCAKDVDNSIPAINTLVLQLIAEKIANIPPPDVNK